MACIMPCIEQKTVNSGIDMVQSLLEQEKHSVFVGRIYKVQHFFDPLSVFESLETASLLWD